MCGIAGQIRFDGGRADVPCLERMCAAIEHRGPDSRGIHAEGGAALGIQRLRVIDLETGDQPIYNEDRSVAVVLNGEIYNYRELRERLTASGHTFATKGDTEPIVHLYEEEGLDFVRHLHGMFALALWDARRQRLVVARDRLGKKPLFYSHRGKVLSFASELPALLADRTVPRDLDWRALDAYLALRYVPSPMSAFAHVRKLPPAHVMTFDAGGIALKRYWRLNFVSKRTTESPEEIHEELREQIRRATARRMISDVPLGAFLSGGVDSACVVAAMAEQSSQPIKTFSIGFTTDDYDELPLARLTAKHFGTDHEEFVVEPKAIEMVPRIVRHHGEPFADASAIPTFYVAEMASRRVTVALNGDGGDEAFAGYTHYVSNRALSHFDLLPRALRRGLARGEAFLPASGKIDSTTSRARRALHTVGLDAADRYAAYRTRLLGLERDTIYTPEFREQLDGAVPEQSILDRWHDSQAADIVDVMLDVDVHTYLPDDLLTKMDIATMASSLEGRSPLLDHEFMEFAASLPTRYKVRRGQKKVALRAALRGWVPDEVLDAPKRGFRAPVAAWLRGDLRELAHETLLDPLATGRGYFREKEVASIIDRHQRGEADFAQGIWTLMMFELWHREFVDAPVAS